MPGSGKGSAPTSSREVRVYDVPHPERTRAVLPGRACFDRLLPAGQDPWDGAELAHLPILAGAALALVTEYRGANLIAPAGFLTTVAVIMIIRFRSMLHGHAVPHAAFF